MAGAYCRDCKRGSNEIECPHCGGPMFSDEVFEPEEGGYHPRIEYAKPSAPKRKPSFFDPETERKRRLELALAGIQERFKRLPTPLERAVASINAQYGEGTIR